MDTILVSVIIPIYNVAPYIAECLESVMRQTCRQMEVLLIDDCGTDESIEIVRTMLGGADEATIGNVCYKILHHEHNRGLSAARNTGIEAARGEWLYFLDSDDWVADDCIETLVNCARQEEGIEMAIGQLETFDQMGRRDVKLPNGDDCPTLRLADGVYDDDIGSRYLSHEFYVMAWNKLVRRDFLLRHDLFFQEGLIHEDTLWSFCCACQLRKIGVVNQKLYHYRIRPGSIMAELREESDVRAKNSILCGQIDYAVTHGQDNNKALFDYLFSRIKIYFLSPRYRTNEAYAADLFTKLGAAHFWSYGQVWRMLPARRDVLPVLSRLLPQSLGLRFCQWVWPRIWNL